MSWKGWMGLIGWIGQDGWIGRTACKKATAMVFIWGDRGYPAVRFEYKTACERYLAAEI